MARTYKLLSVGTNAKTIKSDSEKYTTAIIYMKPDEKTCPMSGPKMANCLKPCLVPFYQYIQTEKNRPIPERSKIIS